MPIPNASLRFSAYAWAKLQYVLKLSDNEVGMFGISSESDPLCIIDLVIPQQEVSIASMEFSGDGMAEFYDDCIESGLTPDRYARVWIHTHPSGVHRPSLTDEKTFEEIFGKCDWAVMYILSKDQHDYCGLQFNKIPKHRAEISGTRVDFSIPFYSSNEENWKKEYDANVKKKVLPIVKLTNNKPKKFKGKLSKYIDIDDELLVNVQEKEDVMSQFDEDSYWDYECWGNDLYREMSPRK